VSLNTCLIVVGFPTLVTLTTRPDASKQGVVYALISTNDPAVSIPIAQIAHLHYALTLCPGYASTLSLTGTTHDQGGSGVSSISSPSTKSASMPLLAPTLVGYTKDGNSQGRWESGGTHARRRSGRNTS